MTRTAVFAGTFDPVTHGHLDLVRRGRQLFDQLVVSVARGGRKTLFSPEERVELMVAALHEEMGEPDGIRVEIFDGRRDDISWFY